MTHYSITSVNLKTLKIGLFTIWVYFLLGSFTCLFTLNTVVHIMLVYSFLNLIYHTHFNPLLSPSPPFQWWHNIEKTTGINL